MPNTTQRKLEICGPVERESDTRTAANLIEDWCLLTDVIFVLRL